MPVNHEELRRRIGDRSQGEIAERAGMQRTHLSRLVNGRAPDVRVSTLDRLAKILGCRARDLID